jgi:hypothetical protein
LQAHRAQCVVGNNGGHGRTRLRAWTIVQYGVGFTSLSRAGERPWTERTGRTPTERMGRAIGCRIRDGCMSSRIHPASVRDRSDMRAILTSYSSQQTSIKRRSSRTLRIDGRVPGPGERPPKAAGVVDPQPAGGFVGRRSRRVAAVPPGSARLVLDDPLRDRSAGTESSTTAVLLRSLAIDVGQVTHAESAARRSKTSIWSRIATPRSTGRPVRFRTQLDAARLMGGR